MDVGSGSLPPPLNRRPLSIMTSRPSAGDVSMAAEEEEPVSPLTRLMEDIYVVVTIGLGTPINLPAFRAGIQSQLARYPRFRRIQVTENEDGEPRWVRVARVNVDDHIVVPRLDPAAVATNPDEAVEDYVSWLVTRPMDKSRPPWEFHLLDFPTSEAASTAVLRVHHSLGDGVSLMTALMASTRSSADPASLPAMPMPMPMPASARTSGAAIYAPRPRALVGFFPWVWSYVVLAWYTAVDVACFVATVLFLRDPHTLFKRSRDHGVFRRKRFVHRSLSLDDVKLAKNAMNCTVNDVLVGMTSAALSRYYFRKSGDPKTRKICLRSVLVVNLRPNTSLQTYVNMIESGNTNDVSWGNRLGYIILPFHIAMHDDPLEEYIRKAKATVDRKKSSLEVIFTNRITQFFLKYFGFKAGAFLFSRMPLRTTLSFTSMVGPAEQVEYVFNLTAGMDFVGFDGALPELNRSVYAVLALDEDMFSDYRELLDDFAESLCLIKDAASKLAKPFKSE